MIKSQKILNFMQFLLTLDNLSMKFEVCKSCHELYCDLRHQFYLDNRPSGLVYIIYRKKYVQCEAMK